MEFVNATALPTRPRRAGLLDLISQGRVIYRERRKLAALPDHQLRDIGLNRDAATAEANRWFWEA